MLKKCSKVMYMKNAFTMVELVFVIVILGILASVAIPKLAATRDDATISKTRSDIASIRSAIISERQTRLIKGDSSWITGLSDPLVSELFTGTDSNHTLLMYGVTEGSTDGGWVETNSTLYTFYLNGESAVFTYSPADGTFNCATNTLCDQLVK